MPELSDDRAVENLNAPGAQVKRRNLCANDTKSIAIQISKTNNQNNKEQAIQIVKDNNKENNKAIQIFKKKHNQKAI